MQTLPRSAQIFLWCIYAVGVAASVSALLVAPLHLAQQGWQLLIFTIVSVLSYSKKIVLFRNKMSSDNGSLSLGFAVTFASILVLGPAGGLIVGVAGCLITCVYPKPQPIHQIAFNIFVVAIGVYFAGEIFVWLNGATLKLRLLQTFPAVAAASIAYFLVNTLAISAIIGLCSKKKIASVWRESFMWTAPSYFAGASVSTLAILLCGSHSAEMLLFLAPVAYLTFQSYTTYMGRAEEKQQHIERLADLYLSTIKSLALAIDAKDQYTHQHILRVQRYAVAVAKEMGISGDELEGINTGALLHDIGKLGVPEYVLLKPGRLTDEEFAKIKKHPEIGAAILGPVEFPWPVLPVVRWHHEKWDGSGYPDGLQGENIPLSARILAVADVYDALTSSRSYRHAWTHERAFDEIKRCAGTHFDPLVVAAFSVVIDSIVCDMAAEAEEEQQLTPDEISISRDSQAAVRDIQRASSELWALYEVAQTLSSSLGLKETLEILSHKLEAILPGTSCLFLLKDGHGAPDDRLVVRAAVGINCEFFQDAQTSSVGSRSQSVTRSQESYLGEYDMEDLLLLSSPSAQWQPLRTALIVPVTHQGEVLGTINLYHPQPDAFGPHDRQLLEMIADRSAMAVYNGLLFDRTRSHAQTDSLTGLYNIRHLTEYVEQLCDAEHAPPFALLCLDLDSFKPINDNFGHQKGDQVLRDLSVLFQDTVRGCDLVARYGGDEFLIIITGAGPAQAAETAQQLREVVESYEHGLTHERLGTIYLGASIGFGCFPTDGTDCATLISAADAQMYRDKLERKLVILSDAKKSLGSGQMDTAEVIALAA